jgi:hypothetical protein
MDMIRVLFVCNQNIETWIHEITCVFRGVLQ